MKNGFIKSLVLSSLIFSATLNSLNVFSAESLTQIVIAPSCLLEDTSFPYEILGKKGDLVLIKANSNDLENHITNQPKKFCGKFRDVSNIWNTLPNTHKKNSSSIHANKILTDEINAFNEKQKLKPDFVDYEILHTENVERLLSNFDSQQMWEGLLKLTSFPNRYARSQHGLDAANWLKSRAEEIAKSTGHSDVTTQMINTGFLYKQPSVVVKVPGTNPNLDAVLLGGHMDTTDGYKPGADDDGSGSATTLEVMRAVLSSGIKFKRTLYFVWYAAEEQGLVGSSVVAKHFKDSNIGLRGVLHFDMTGYQPKPENKIYVLDDYVNKDLSDFVVNLAKKYAKVDDVGHTRCGYACSDHASWTRFGYPSAVPIETSFSDSSPYIHTSQDTPDTISAEHMSRFTKIGIGFVGELAEPV